MLKITCIALISVFVMTGCLGFQLSPAFYELQIEGLVDGFDVDGNQCEIFNLEGRKLLKISEAPNKEGKQQINVYELDEKNFDFAVAIFRHWRLSALHLPLDQDKMVAKILQAHEILRRDLLEFSEKHGEKQAVKELISQIDSEELALKDGSFSRDTWLVLREFVFKRYIEALINTAPRVGSHERLPQMLKAVPSQLEFVPFHLERSK